MTDELKHKRILNVSQAARYSGYCRGWIEYWLAQEFLPIESPPGQGEEKPKMINDLSEYEWLMCRKRSRKYGV